jgi:hypothetical protein
MRCQVCSCFESRPVGPVRPCSSLGRSYARVLLGCARAATHLSADARGLGRERGDVSDHCAREVRSVPDRLYFTESDAANSLIASDPMALLVGFVLDQQVTVQQAFVGPLTLRQRLGAFDAATLAKADLEPVFREKPAIHRYPGSMAKRVHDLAVLIEDRYDGDATASGPMRPIPANCAPTWRRYPASGR